MEEYEMDDLNPSMCMQPMISHAIEIENNNFGPICRHCNEDDSKGELIRPCECTGDREFMHIHCLEELENTSNLTEQSYCTHCNVAFSLEVKYKSLIQICRNSREMCHIFRTVWSFLFIVLCILIYNAFMIILITVFSTLTVRPDITLINYIFNYAAIVAFAVLTGLHIPYELKLLKNAFVNFRRAHSQWLAVNTERKLIKSIHIREVRLL